MLIPDYLSGIGIKGWVSIFYAYSKTNDSYINTFIDLKLKETSKLDPTDSETIFYVCRGINKSKERLNKLFIPKASRTRKNRASKNYLPL